MDDNEPFDTTTEKWLAARIRERCNEELMLYSDQVAMLASAAGVFPIVAQYWLERREWDLKQALRVFDGLGLDPEELLR